MSASQRFQKHYFYRKSIRGHVVCPLYRGCPLFGESAIRSFTVFANLAIIIYRLCKQHAPVGGIDTYLYLHTCTTLC